MTYANLTEKQKQFVDLAISEGHTEEITTKDIKELQTKYNNTLSVQWLQKDDTLRMSRGVYRLPKVAANGSVVMCESTFNPVAAEPTMVATKIDDKVTKIEPSVPVSITNTEDVSFVPENDLTFVPFGQFKDIHSIIKSKLFYTGFITGLSGNGKTFLVEQSCAKAKRELFRVNITIETDEDDLLGHYVLINGQTVWQDGPVIQAMDRGAVLLLDEVDLASNKIMCLQPVLEGKGVYVKKINRFVKPKIGFNVIATANTKGKGSDDGRYIGTNILNEAFLERFAITIEQEYPTPSIEKKILIGIMQSLGCLDDGFAQKLVDWADIIRKTYYDGGIDEIIATRRLVHIVNAFKIFGDRMKAIQLCVNRFDDETKQAFLDLYTKVDGEVDKPSEESSEGGGSEDDSDDLTPF
tara:strand:- start:22650 stop:23879 length:1230 start_codon:yes stop_codon:yes gene_type:complete